MRTTVIDDEIEGFRIAIVAPTNLALRLFLPVWLCGWAAGEIAVPVSVLSGSEKGLDLIFLAVWLCFWTTCGVLAMLALAWNWAGREIISFREDRLSIARQVGPLSRSKMFDLSGVSHVRYSPIVYNPFSFDRSNTYYAWGLGGGSIAFDYREPDGDAVRPVHFGDRLPELEARRLILTIEQRFKIPGEQELKPLPVQH